MGAWRGWQAVGLMGMGWAGSLGCSSHTSIPPTVAKAEALIAAAPPRAGELRLKCIPSDADVTLDGVPQGRCDDFDGTRGLRVGEGLHRIELRKSGYWPYVTYYEASGVRAVLEARLAPMAGQGEGG